jgi:hypothetical protein
MKVILAVVTAVTLAAALSTSSPAEARCWWNGYRWVCVHHHPWWWYHRPHGWHYSYWRHRRCATTTRIAAVDHIPPPRPSGEMLAQYLTMQSGLSRVCTLRNCSDTPPGQQETLATTKSPKAG